VNDSNDLSADKRSQSPERARRPPSALLFGAALAGLLGLPVTGCDEESTPNSDKDKDKEEDSGIDSWEDAGDEPNCACEEKDAATNKEDTGTGAGQDAGAGDAGGLDAGDAAVCAPQAPEKLGEEKVGDISFANLKADCDKRGGYMQVHAGCSGSNDCAGFSYGDWNPGELMEHTCAQASGCTGASCVVLPKDTGKTPEQILFDTDELPFGGSQPCWFCHSESEKQADGTYKRDKTLFKVWVPAGSTRTETNWLDLSAAQQEQIVAFGAITRMGPPGQEVTVRSMREYHKLYSRAEIERVVKHLRTLKPVIKVITAPK